ncbi:hypothetical protein F5Y09DRAFT_341579 [Xylaria sp. FL1042]|nr:hypothetical protein F5Y09DRAFT_341579 [Xylaria sp. FL1042]
MAIRLHSYTATRFNATPGLPDALQRHQEAGGNDWVHNMFRPLFRRHGVEKILGIGVRVFRLLHHHFPLEDDEFLTEVRGTSTAWKSQRGTRPHVWALGAEEGSLTPLGFAMDDDQDFLTYPDWESKQLQQFIRELSELIMNLNVDGVYGLVRYPGDDFPGRVEMTVGRANVNSTPAQAAKHDPAYQSEAAWYFTEGFRKRGCSCNCFHHGTSNSTIGHVVVVQ